MTAEKPRGRRPALRVLDLFSCVGCHAIGMHRAGHRTVGFIEIRPERRAVLAKHFPGIPVHDDVQSYRGEPGEADFVIGGPPCQQTSVAAAVHGKRSGASLWPEQLRIARNIQAVGIVVEQPAGNAEWESNVAEDCARAGYHTARFEFEARDVGAPYERRRVFILAFTCMQRLEIAWSTGSSAIEHVARAANARGTWDPSKLRALRVDARSAGEMDRTVARTRRERIEALGDSNPPEMAEVIGLMLRAAAESHV